MPYHRYVPGKQDRQNAIVPDTTSNQLGVLTAVVEDEDRGVAGEYVRAGSHFEFVPALGRRADGQTGGQADCPETLSMCVRRVTDSRSEKKTSINAPGLGPDQI